MIYRPSPHGPPLDLRLAAIDLDGTLLGPDLTISSENRRAVAKLHAANIEVVLASGRHHDAILPFARQLPEVRWLVSAQGAEVSDVARTHVLSQAFLARERIAQVATLQAQLDVTALFYAPEGILTPSASNEAMAFYTALTGLVPSRRPLAEMERRAIYKVVCVGSSEVIDVISADERVAVREVQVVRTHRRLLEFMPLHVSKAFGLAALAKHLGLTAENVVAFGDAENDLPMFDWAGWSFAMAHGWPAAKARARHVAPDGPPETALARAIDLLG
jgi:Cof subfamily protein (haloacid dehalogenase superfamily)